MTRIMRRDSANAELNGGAEAAYIVVNRADLDTGTAWSVCEWHHLSGYRLGFYPKNEAEQQKCDELLTHIKERKEVEKELIALTAQGEKTVCKNKAELVRWFQKAKVGDKCCVFGTAKSQSGAACVGKFGLFFDDKFSGTKIATEYTLENNGITAQKQLG